MVEVTLDPDDSKINVRNRIKSAAARRGLDVSFVRVRDESLLRFELHSANGDTPPTKKK